MFFIWTGKTVQFYVEFMEKNAVDPACIGGAAETQKSCLSAVSMVALTRI